MGQKFCTICGAVLSEGVKFCENCGAAVEQIPPASAPSPVSQAPLTMATSLPETMPKGNPNAKIIAGIVIVLVVLAGAACIFVLPGLSGSNSLPISSGGTGFTASTPSPATVIVTTPTPIPTTIVPTPTPNPFPDAYSIRELFNFNEGKYASRATVYRVWMNETYQWHNDMDNRYYTQKPKAGNKYLLVYVNIENIGSNGYPYPKSSTILLHNDGNIYNVDPSHYLPDKAGDRKATPVEIQEIEQQSDYFKMERVEDYGYSHGTTQDFVYPGQGNAIDGYLIYEVPASLTPENTYVEIIFDGQDRAVWKLG
ncbi:MAG: zinc-ribbon domain-containing protein [Methanoregula sp.]|nr:zinc-ribbon domain-containing protein [Methanoregula sp.]